MVDLDTLIVPCGLVGTRRTYARSDKTSKGWATTRVGADEANRQRLVLITASLAPGRGLSIALPASGVLATLMQATPVAPPQSGAIVDVEEADPPARTAPPRSEAWFSLADPADTRIGQSLYAFGYPFVSKNLSPGLILAVGSVTNLFGLRGIDNPYPLFCLRFLA